MHARGPAPRTESTSGRERRPNVLLVTIDTLRADHCSSYGYYRSTTPVLDEVAAQGTLFESAYTPTPTTGPAHASLFTSSYPFVHGVLKNGHSLPAERTALAEVLQQEGYTTLPLALPMLVLAGEGLCWIEDEIRMRRTLHLLGATVLVVMVAPGTHVLPQDPWILLGLLILGVSAAWALRPDESPRPIQSTT